MPRLLFALALAFQCLLASAAPLEIGSSWSDLYLPDQHDKAVSVTSDKLRALLFTAERKPGDFLPRKAGAVTVLTLDAGRITAIEFAGDEAALEQLLEQRLK